RRRDHHARPRSHDLEYVAVERRVGRRHARRHQHVLQRHHAADAVARRPPRPGLRPGEVTNGLSSPSHVDRTRIRLSQPLARLDMTRRLLIALAVMTAPILAAPGIGHAQTFNVQKFDIKGEGGTDYVAVEAATGRGFVSRGDHMMVVDSTGKVLADIKDTPGVHGAGIATKAGHGFTTNGGDMTVTMFDLKTLAVIKKIPVTQGGLDGIMYDEPDDKIILTNHSNPGTVTAID